MASGLHVAGRPLEPPRIQSTDWKEGQIFSLLDDPDRTQEPWDSPTFLRLKSPTAQSAKTTVDELDVRRIAGSTKSSFARVVHGALDEEDCAELIACINNKGYTPALLNIGGGKQMLVSDRRDGHRVIVDSPELSQWLFAVLRPHLPERHGGAQLIELNDRCRFLCYTPGQYFAPHYDGLFVRPMFQPNAGDFSAVTVQLYLHAVPKTNGGATTFLSNRERPVCEFQPGAGDVLIFTQDLYHEGSTVNAGLKYTFRTEAMYRDK